jgi:hypothetical protein
MNSTQLDRDPTEGATAEWLVISAGVEDAATDAVRQARERGMRVDHLILPSAQITEPELQNGAATAKHIIVAETSGRVAEMVQRFLPHIGVVPVTDDAPAEAILHRLLHTPRCC